MLHNKFHPRIWPSALDIHHTGRREFLRRGGGRTSSGGSVVGGAKDVGGSAEVGDGAGAAGGGTRRQEIVLGEVCPVCQEEMEGGGDEERGEGATTARAGLTYCRDGCGNNMHARCENAAGVPRQGGLCKAISRYKAVKTAWHD